MNMQRITLIVGIQQDKDGKEIPISQAGRALNKLRVDLSQRSGGYTETVTHGGWYHDGHLIQEDSSKFEMVMRVSAEEAESIGKQLAQHAAKLLNQHSVLLQVEPVNAYFVRQGGAE